MGPALHSLVQRLGAADEAAAQEVAAALRAGRDRFLRQYDETYALLGALPEPADAVGPLRGALHAYAALHEIDLPLWFLGVVGKACRDGKFDATYLGGPATTTPQASLVGTVEQTLVGTPLHEPFLASYDPVLRNAVGHNDYEITGSGEACAVTDHRTGTTWSADEVWDAVASSQYALQAVLVAAETVLAWPDATTAARFADRGVNHAAYAVDGAGQPMMVLTQLWCFRDLDPEGRWIDASELGVVDNGDGTERATLTAHAWSEGAAVTTTEFGRAAP